MAVDDAPTVLRFPKGTVGVDYDAVRRTDDGVDVLAESGRKDVLLVTVGPMAGIGLAGRRAARGPGHRRDGRRPALGRARAARASSSSPRDHRIVVSIEDGIRVGGIGTRIRQDLREADVDTAVTEIGLPDEFLEHGSRGDILERVGLTPQHIARDVTAMVLGSKLPHARGAGLEARVERHAPAAARLTPALGRGIRSIATSADAAANAAPTENGPPACAGGPFAFWRYAPVPRTGGWWNVSPKTRSDAPTRSR